MLILAIKCCPMPSMLTQDPGFPLIYCQTKICKHCDAAALRLVTNLSLVYNLSLLYPCTLSIYTIDTVRGTVHLAIPPPLISEVNQNTTSDDNGEYRNTDDHTNSDIGCIEVALV